MNISGGITASAAGVGTVFPQTAPVMAIVAAVASLTSFEYPYEGQAEVINGANNGADMWNTFRARPHWHANLDDPSLLNMTDENGNFNGFTQCNLELWMVKHWRHQTWAADHYNANGYHSSGYVIYADPIDKVEEEAFYTRVTGTRPATPQG